MKKILRSLIIVEICLSVLSAMADIVLEKTLPDRIQGYIIRNDVGGLTANEVFKLSVGIFGAVYLAEIKSYFSNGHAVSANSADPKDGSTD